MARASSWLSFSQSHTEMLLSYQNQIIPTKLSPFHIASDSSQQYPFHDFNENEWAEVDAPALFADENNEYTEYSKLPAWLPSPFQEPIPKLENFLSWHSSSFVRYSDSQTDTQESSLSSVYEQDFMAVAPASGFKAFPSSSGSEIVDSSALTVGKFAGYSPEYGNGFSFAGGVSGFSLTATQSLEKGAISTCTEGTVRSRKTADSVGQQRTSSFRGVTRHRWTGRYEAHLWDNTCRREGQSRKGRQVYLGGYDKEEKAARAYDLAALKYWGCTASTNFPVASYTEEMEEMKIMTKPEFVASLRRKSSGFSRGASIYRGVTRHHQQGKWQARIGRVAGNKDLYLGTFVTEEEAAEAYDIAAIKFRGANAVTNFPVSRYNVEAIVSSVLPIGPASKRLKHQLSQSPPTLNSTCTLQFGPPDNSSTAALFQKLFQLGPVASSEQELSASGVYCRSLQEAKATTKCSDSNTVKKEQSWGGVPSP